MGIVIVPGDVPYTFPRQTVDSIETQISKSFQVNIDAREYRLLLHCPACHGETVVDPDAGQA